ncbi:hypothetical protein P5G50_09705 [Leifsonia sp. F6_8S_P_1B]|uniref:Uridine kinase n=1 Tax=Leifsonia williamsii TaxID=3035919 RepID=A0ABT8KCN2_9MICO|nr:hypothetical protein [Leifsonia williamsii]MDN4614728.1 hypothetical protein [Leifsonia williamsii]
MRLPPTPRVLFLRELVGEVLRVAPLGRVIVAVDGRGVERFADALAEVFEEAGNDTFRASITDFHRPRADRTRLGPETPESYYRHSYDYRTLRRVLLDPFRLAGSTGFQLAAFDEVRDVPVESRWLTAGPDAVLIIDGEFLLRPELRDRWDASVLVVSAPEDPVYEADARPREHSDLLVDNSDPAHPIRA